MTKSKLNILIFSFITLIFFGCNENWDDYYKIQDDQLNNLIFQELESRSDLTKFIKYLRISGYDKELSSDISYSVWAQSDNIISEIPENDTVAIKNYIGYCITVGTYEDEFTSGRIRMLNGKYAELDMSASKIDQKNFESEPILCKNGLLYSATEKFEPLKNVWEIFIEDAPTSLQKNYILTLDDLIFDEANSEITGVDEETGLSIYDTVWIFTNYMLLESGDMESESEEFTFIVLSDSSFTNTVNNYSGYYKPEDSTETEEMAKFNTAVDLVINEKILPDNFTGKFYSSTGVEMNLSADNIVSYELASNGIIYYVRSNPVSIDSKFEKILIEGENLTNSQSLNWIINKVYSASGGYELRVEEASFGNWVEYTFQIPYPAKYNIYLCGLASPAYNQNLDLFEGIPVQGSQPVAAFTEVSTISSYNGKTLAGTYTFDESKTVTLRVVCASDPAQPITVDRIIIEPTNE